MFFIGCNVNCGLTVRNIGSLSNTQVSNVTYAYSDSPILQTIQQTSPSIAQLYQTVQDSVVVITGVQSQVSQFGQTSDALVQGSGFIYNFEDRMVVITNFHVINQARNIVVTFPNGNGYAANVLGADPYVDLAVLSTDAPASEYKPLQIVSSSSLQIGDFVAAFGTPFGLVGSITVGVVSQLGRTIDEPLVGNYPIANVIQTDAPINPGNSGGPLLNSEGQVVGVNTATVSGSTGVGFAIPSDTILREIDELINTGTYNKHPYLGISSVDVNYYIAQEMNVDVTYGVLIQNVVNGGPADEAELRAGDMQVTITEAPILIGGDIIIAIEGDRIINTDGLSSYLSENTLPDQQITITIIRNGQTQDVQVILGTRPSPDITVNSVPTELPAPTIPEVTSVIAISALATTIAVFGIIVNRKRKKDTVNINLQ